MPRNMNNNNISVGEKRVGFDYTRGRASSNGFQKNHMKMRLPRVPEEEDGDCGGGVLRFPVRQASPPAPSSLPSSISSSPYLGELDLQEKVSVRLDENQGLVVARDEEEDDHKYPSDCNLPQLPSNKSATNLSSNPANSSKSKQCKKPARLSIGLVAAEDGAPSSISMTKTNLQENMEEAFRIAASLQQPKGSATASTSAEGLSSLTPLMDAVVQREQYKMLVTPSSSMMKSRENRINFARSCSFVFSFCGTLFFSLTLLLTKVLKNRDHHPLSVAFWRYLGIFVPSVPLVLFYIFRGKSHKKVVGVIWPMRDMDKAATGLALLMRGVLGSTAVILRFCSLKYLTIADSTVISYCAPVFAALFTPMCVKKARGVIVPILVGLVAAFAIFIVGAGYDPETLKGVLFASLSMLCSSGVLILARNLLQKVHFSLVMIVLGIWGSFEAGVLALSLNVLKVPQLLPDIVMIFGVAVLTFFGQIFILTAMKMGRIGSVSVVRSCDIILSFVWQYLFLKTEPEMLGVISAILIILAVWFISFRSWVGSLRSTNPIRERFSIILY